MLSHLVERKGKNIKLHDKSIAELNQNGDRS